MKDNLDELLKEAYRNQKIDMENINKKVLEKVEEKNKTDYEKQEENIIAIKSRKIASIAATLVFVLVLGAGGVKAAINFFDINHFIEDYGTKLDEKAENIIDTDPMVSISECENMLDYKVTSVLCDSRNIVLTVDIKLKDTENYILNADSYDANRKISDLYAEINSEESVGEYLKKHNLKILNASYFELDKSCRKYGEIQQFSGKNHSNDSATVLLEIPRTSYEKKFILKLVPKFFTINSDGVYGKRYADKTISFEVKDKSTETTAEYIIADKENATKNGITMKKIILTTTELGTYMDGECIVNINPGEADMVLCDNEGAESYNMLTLGNNISYVENENTVISELIYERMELPDKIYVNVSGNGNNNVFKMKKSK